MAQMQKLILANNIDRAIKLCNAAPNAALAARHQGGADARQQGRGRDLATPSKRRASRSIRERQQAHADAAATSPTSSTLLGLLGTIVGLIEAFTAVAAAPPDMKSQMLTAVARHRPERDGVRPHRRHPGARASSCSSNTSTRRSSTTSTSTRAQARRTCSWRAAIGGRRSRRHGHQGEGRHFRAPRPGGGDPCRSAPRRVVTSRLTSPISTSTR